MGWWTSRSICSGNKGVNVSEGNGKIREIEPSGIEKYKFGRGDDFVIVELDVVGTMDLWGAERAKYQDETGSIAKEHKLHVNAVTLKFVQGIVKNAGEPKDKAEKVAASLSAGEANRFLKLLVDDVEALYPLWQPASATKPSSADSLEPIYAQ